MINLIKLILFFLSTGMYSCTNIDGTLFNALNENRDTLPGITLYTLNHFASKEHFVKFPAEGKTWAPITISGGYHAYFTLFSTFTEVDLVSNELTGFQVTIKCGDTAIFERTQDNYLMDGGDADDFISANKGVAPGYRRKNYLLTETVELLTCGSTDKLNVILGLTGTGTYNFLIKQFALYNSPCHPGCDVCTTAPACETCSSSFTKAGSNGCQCTSNPPTLGVVQLSPLIDTTNHRFQSHCKRVNATISLPCDHWEIQNPSSFAFDYCLTCGGSSKKSQYLALPYTYTDGPTPGNTGTAYAWDSWNPDVSQNICQCPLGTSAHFYNSIYQCYTPAEWTCISSGYNTEMDTAAIFAYLKDLSTNLQIDLNKMEDPLLGAFYNMTFKVLHPFTPSYLLNFKVYYKIAGKPVHIIVGHDTTKNYSIHINPDSLGSMGCSPTSISQSAKLWKCQISIIAYNPCTNLAYKDSFIPIEFGDGLITGGSSVSVFAKFALTELDIPCLINSRCFINKDYSTELFHCATPACTAERPSTPAGAYTNGELVWVKPVLFTYKSGETPASFNQILEFATFYYYDPDQKPIATVNVRNNANYGFTSTNEALFGFPIEITGEIADSGALSPGGKVSLVVTFKLEHKRLMRMLQDSEQFSITAPVTLKILIAENQGNTDYATALIAVLTIVGAGIIGFVVYCLLRRKKKEEKKLDPQEVKICVMDHGSTSLCTAREQKLQGQDARI